MGLELKIAMGILIAFVCITFAKVFAEGMMLLLKLIWIFIAPNEDARLAKYYRKREAGKTEESELRAFIGMKSR